MVNVISYKEFLEEYEQNHIRSFIIPSAFISQYRYAQLTYDEWMALLNMYIPGEVPEDEWVYAAFKK